MSNKIIRTYYNEDHVELTAGVVRILRTSRASLETKPVQQSDYSLFPFCISNISSTQLPGHLK